MMIARKMSGSSCSRLAILAFPTFATRYNLLAADSSNQTVSEATWADKLKDVIVDG
jgi:hypothetical protein